MSSIDLKAEIQDILEEYSDEVVDVTEEVIKSVSDNAVKKLKNNSPIKTGKYAKGWKNEVRRKNLGVEAKVFNAKDPHKTHLLENGHVTRNGTGRTYAPTPAHSHIASVNEETQKELSEELERRLQE